MATEIIASGTTDANSADRTIASGATETLILRATASVAECAIELKGSDSAYYTVGSLGSAGRVQQITGPVVYRVRRLAGVACAVDVEA